MPCYAGGHASLLPARPTLSAGRSHGVVAWAEEGPGRGGYVSGQAMFRGSETELRPQQHHRRAISSISSDFWA